MHSLNCSMKVHSPIANHAESDRHHNTLTGTKWVCRRDRINNERAVYASAERLQSFGRERSALC